MALDVLFVSCEGRLGGAERSLLSLASQLRAYEQVAIACLEGSALAQAAQAVGVEAIGLRLLPGRLTLGRIPAVAAGAKQLRSLIRARQPRLVHANSIYSLPVALGALCTDVPVVAHLRDICRHGVAAWLYDRCRATIAVSAFAAESLVSHGGRAALVVANGLEAPLGSFHSMALGAATCARSAPDRFVFANIGQFVSWKRQDHFVSAAEAHGDRASCEYWLVGGCTNRQDRYGRSLLLRASQARPQVRLLGWQEDMEPVWERWDALFIRPRLSHSVE